MSDRAELAGAWKRLTDELAAPKRPARAWGGRLLRAYTSPLRAYHTAAHIRFLLGEIDRRRDAIADHVRLRLAAFFHDFIYRTWRRDNEAKSAEAAATALAAFAASSTLRTRVPKLILSTAGHAPPDEADADDLLFLDMDLSILGAPAVTYDRYARQVRREYFWVSPKAYRNGRGAFLRAMTARRRVFNTNVYEREMGAQARENMARELAGLQEPRTDE
jgi:predicted metal-dependent HD superfamily phosphohydrolase